MKFIYFAYPYASDPEARTREVKEKVRAVMAARGDIVPLVPHCAFDFLYDMPHGYDCPFMLNWEVFIISSKVDYICVIPSSPGIPTCGIYWERAVAQVFDVPEVDYDYLLDGGEI